MTKKSEVDYLFYSIIGAIWFAVLYAIWAATEAGDNIFDKREGSTYRSKLSRKSNCPTNGDDWDWTKYGCSLV